MVTEIVNTLLIILVPIVIFLVLAFIKRKYKSDQDNQFLHQLIDYPLLGIASLAMSLYFQEIEVNTSPDWAFPAYVIVLSLLIIIQIFLYIRQMRLIWQTNPVDDLDDITKTQGGRELAVYAFVTLFFILVLFSILGIDVRILFILIIIYPLMALVSITIIALGIAGSRFVLDYMDYRKLVDSGLREGVSLQIHADTEIQGEIVEFNYRSLGVQNADDSVFYLGPRRLLEIGFDITK